jgi:hypothetical protein
MYSPTSCTLMWSYALSSAIPDYRVLLLTTGSFTTSTCRLPYRSQRLLTSAFGGTRFVVRGGDRRAFAVQDLHHSPGRVLVRD